MTSRLETLLALDMSRIDVRRGLLGAVAVLGAIVFVAVFGPLGMTVGIAALFVIAADQPGPARQRWAGVLVISLVGSFIALIAVWAGTEHIWVATLLTFTITGAATLAAGLGHVAAIRALLLSLWAVLAFSLTGDGETALALAMAFLAGGVIAAVILWLGSRGSEGPSVEVEAETAARTVEEIVHSPLGWFALLRAGAVGVATALGIVLFPDHAMWPALTVLLVMRPKTGEAVEAGARRTFGTLAGVIVAEAVVAVAGGSEVVMFLAFMLGAFAMVALKQVNYWVFVFFLTALLVLSEVFVGGDAEAAGVQRFIATVLGAGIAFIGIGLGHLILQRQKEQATT